jgi:GT2 family glycosyltransferase
MNPNVCIILVNWNQRDDIVECLQSISKIDYDNYKVVISDNGSRDGSVEEIERLFPEALIIQNRRNLGYSAANNVAIEWAIKNNYKYVFLLNSDTVVHPKMLNEIVGAAEREDAYGVVGPMVLSYYESDRISFAGGKFDLKLGKEKHIFENMNYKNVSLAPLECDYITGCAMLLRISALTETGLFDDKLFMYCEDTDLCLRMKQKGLRILFIPDGIVWHKIERWVERISISPYRAYYSSRNTLYIMKKYHITTILLLWKIFRIIFVAIRLQVAYEGGIIYPFIKGIGDFITGKTGNMETPI